MSLALIQHHREITLVCNLSLPRWEARHPLSAFIDLLVQPQCEHNAVSEQLTLHKKQIYQLAYGMHMWFLLYSPLQFLVNTQFSAQISSFPSTPWMRWHCTFAPQQSPLPESAVRPGSDTLVYFLESAFPEVHSVWCALPQILTKAQSYVFSILVPYRCITLNLSCESSLWPNAPPPPTLQNVLWMKWFSSKPLGSGSFT